MSFIRKYLENAQIRIFSLFRLNSHDKPPGLLHKPKLINEELRRIPGSPPGISIQDKVLHYEPGGVEDDEEGESGQAGLLNYHQPPGHF
jgi:hypothetical protein